MICDRFPINSLKREIWGFGRWGDPLDSASETNIFMLTGTVQMFKHSQGRKLSKIVHLLKENDSTEYWGFSSTHSYLLK